MLQKIKFRTKLAIILIMPLIGLIFFSFNNTIEKFNQYNEMEALNSMSVLSKKIGELVHETQKERGITGGYIGSCGNNFVSELRVQQQKTDKKTDDLNQYIETFDSPSFGYEFDFHLKNALKNLNKIEFKRDSIFDLHHKLDSALEYYTGMNAEFLYVVSNISKISTNTKITNLTLAYNYLLLGKEKAGQERAVLTSAFAIDSFSVERLYKFNSLVTEQTIFQNFFLVYANEDQKAFYKNKMSSKVVSAIEKTRAIALTKAIDGNLDIDPKIWFNTITSKIDLLKSVEDKVAQDIEIQALFLKKDAERALWLYIMITVFIIGTVIFLANLITKTHKNLKDSEIRFKLIFENANDAIFWADAKTGTIINCNNEAEKLLELKKSEIIGQNQTFIYPQDKMRYYKKAFKSFIKNKLTKSIELEVVAKSKKIIPVEISASYTTVENTEIIQGIFRDITERKKANAEIQKLSKAVTQSPATIVITDLDGNIEYVNPGFTKLTGYSKKEVIGQNCSILKTTKTKPGTHKELWDTITLGKVWDGEFINKKKNGDEFIEKAVIAPIINDKGIILNYIAIKQDITKRKKADEALIESEKKLKELNATKDKFFSIIAHDLKNPFNALIGFSNLLLNDYNDFDDQTREKFIKEINSSSVNTFKLLENLLTWSRSQMGGIEYSPEKLHLNTLISDAISSNIAMANKKEILLLRNVTDNEMIFGDVNMIDTVLRNIISNAIKFTPKSGKVIISTEKQKDSSFIDISILDTGVGIPKDKINDLFRIDKNVSTVGTEKETGTGLGLILCKEFVKKNGGKINVKSEEGKGSEFIISLPVVNS